MAAGLAARLRARPMPLFFTSVAAFSVGYAVSEQPFSVRDSLDAVIVVSQGLLRSSRAVYTFAANSFDYKYSLRWYDYKSEKYYEERSLVHIRAANRILRLCEANRGFYIKAGQFVASLQQMPKEYVSILSVLQDQALSCPFKVVERVLKEEFGNNAMDMYQKFDEQPVAAASLAQVHHAILKNGQEVAVKVQYPMLQQQFRIDVATMDILSRAVAWLFPDYQFQWVVPEFEKTLSKELDFEQEANNAERTTKCFKRNGAVKIPGIFWEVTSHRVLTMEFMHGCKVDDVQCLQKAGVDPQKVAQMLVEIFAQMIFCDGYVHGDPHPGNILVQCGNARGRKEFDLVLLDHGLYRELDESFRSDFCHLWKALVLLDRIEMQQIGKRLGAGKHFKYLPVIFAGRTLDSTSGLGQGMSVAERKQLREEVQMLTLGDVSQFMESLPRDLLIVLRTDGLLRSIISKLGAQPRMRLFINAKYAVLGLSTNKAQKGGHKSQSWRRIVKSQLHYVNLCLRLEMLELQYKMKDLYVYLLHLLSYLLNALDQKLPWRKVTPIPVLS